MRHTSSLRCSLLLLSVALTGALGCDPMPPDPDGGMQDANVEPRLTVGAGEGRFAEFADNDTLPLVSGCQGSQHVWVALRAEGIERTGTIIELELIRLSDMMPVSQTFRVRISFRDVGASFVELTGLTLIVDDPDEALGEDLLLRATIEDRNEIELTEERPIRIEFDPDGGCG